MVSVDFVAVFDANGGLPGDGGGEGELVVVACGASVGEAELCDHEQVALFFEVSVAQPAFAEQLGSPHLEPDGVDAVMDVAHGVALDVARADLDGSTAQVRGQIGEGVGGGHWREVIRWVHGFLDWVDGGHGQVWQPLHRRAPVLALFGGCAVVSAAAYFPLGRKIVESATWKHVEPGSVCPWLILECYS